MNKNLIIFYSLILLILGSKLIQAKPINTEYLGGGWLPLNENEAKYGGNLDEGSYWYELNKKEDKIYLTLEKLERRTADGKPIFNSLDIVEIPELMNPNIYGLMRGDGNNCWYPNNQIFRNSRILIIVKYNKNTATPIRSFRANLEQEQWEIPLASTIQGLVCELYQP